MQFLFLKEQVGSKHSWQRWATEEITEIKRAGNLGYSVYQMVFLLHEVKYYQIKAFQVCVPVKSFTGNGNHAKMASGTKSNKFLSSNDGNLITPAAS